MDGFLPELVVLERVGAGAQREACRRPERQDRAPLRADRTIASLPVVEVGPHLETHPSAMAAASIGLGPGHLLVPSPAESRFVCPAVRGPRVRPRTTDSNNSTCRKTPSAPRSVSR